MGKVEHFEEDCDDSMPKKAGVWVKTKLHTNTHTENIKGKSNYRRKNL